jgi:hypothetical protein
VLVRARKGAQTLGLAGFVSGHGPGSGSYVVIGDRGQATCQKLWERVPEAYRGGHCYSDFLEAYQGVIPADRHTAG